MKPVLRGILWSVIGFAIGAALVMAIRALMGLAPWSDEPVIFTGYIFGFSGWLLGVGVWESWAAEWFGKPVVINQATGWRRYFAFTTDHKVIGVQYLVTFGAIMLIAGLLAMFMRWELMQPGRDLFNLSAYNRTMSLHGMFMIAVAVTVISGPFGNFIMPIMLGADDMAFPRMNALSYWITPAVPVLLIASQFLGGWDSGWTGYAPLSVTTQSGQLLYGLAFSTLGLSSIVGAVNFIATIVTMRARGLTWSRLPIFVWSIFVTAILSLLATNFVFTVMLMVIFDRMAGFGFFMADQGGQPILYQHIFWFYSHPAVYIMALPGLGVLLEVLAHFSRKPLFAYKWAVAGFVGIGLLSFVVWAHHMFTSGMPDYLRPAFMVSTELISIPTGFIFLAALGTIWRGRLWLRTPMLFALGIVFNFLIGGITGVFLADVPTDIHLQDTFFVVGHFHFTIVSAQIFGLMAAVYYWFPKMTGRMFSEKLGKLHFWWMFITFNTTFIPMFWLGVNGMNRRVGEYSPELQPVNMWVSLSAFLLGASFLFFVYIVVSAWVRGPAAQANPWKARTLEWQTSSPPPLENFDEEPEVVGDPYGYGTPGSVHALVGAGAGGTD